MVKSEHSSIVSVNQVELASELAHNSCINELYGHDVFVEQSNGDTIYTDEAQEVFNRWYDYYFDIINKIKEA